jgi:hypothetical protein
MEKTVTTDHSNEETVSLSDIENETGHSERALQPGAGPDVPCLTGSSDSVTMNEDAYIALGMRRASSMLGVTRDEIRLACGEMSENEMRIVLAVLEWRRLAIIRKAHWTPIPEPPKEEKYGKSKSIMTNQGIREIALIQKLRRLLDDIEDDTRRAGAFALLDAIVAAQFSKNSNA